MEFGRVLEITEDVWVLEISLSEVESWRYLNKDLCDFRNESVLCESVIYDDHFISFLGIVELFPITGISQGNCCCFESPNVGDEGNRASSSGKRTHMESEPSIAFLYLRDVISTLINVAKSAKQIIFGNDHIVKHDISVIDIIQSILRPAITYRDSWQHSMSLLASQRDDEGMRTV